MMRSRPRSETRCLARVARVSPGARTVVEAVAVAPQEMELWLVDAVAADAAERLEECLAAGILTPRPAAVAFRHELARLAVEESLPPNVKAALHRKALAALATPPKGSPDAARLAHHAEAAGDDEAVLRFAPDAAVRAAALGAHREAASQYARALRFAGGLPLDERARLLGASRARVHPHRRVHRGNRRAPARRWSATGDSVTRAPRVTRFASCRGCSGLAGRHGRGRGRRGSGRWCARAARHRPRRDPGLLRALRPVPVRGGLRARPRVGQARARAQPRRSTTPGRGSARADHHRHGRVHRQMWKEGRSSSRARSSSPGKRDSRSSPRWRFASSRPEPSLPICTATLRPT